MYMLWVLQKGWLRNYYREAAGRFSRRGAGTQRGETFTPTGATEAKASGAFEVAGVVVSVVVRIWCGWRFRAGGGGGWESGLGCVQDGA